QWTSLVINVQFAGNNIGGFPCARQWAGQNHIWTHRQFAQGSCHCFDFFAPLFRQRALVIGFVPTFPICLSVPQKIQFHWSTSNLPCTRDYTYSRRACQVIKCCDANVCYCYRLYIAKYLCAFARALWSATMVARR